MPRHKKSKKPIEKPKNYEVGHAVALGIGVCIDKGVQYVLKRKKAQATVKPETPSPKSQEVKEVAPSLRSFIGEQTVFHESLQEQKKAGKQFLKRL
jgi:hypothetical protein